MKQNIVVVSLRENADGTRFGFGVTEDTGENVYIPVNSIAFAKCPVEEGRSYKVALSENANHSEKAAYFCTFIFEESFSNE